MRLSDNLTTGAQHLDVSLSEGFCAMSDARTPTDFALELRVVQDVPPVVHLVTPEPECSPGDQDSVVREVDQVDELLAMDLLVTLLVTVLPLSHPGSLGPDRAEDMAPSLIGGGQARRGGMPSSATHKVRVAGRPRTPATVVDLALPS